MSLSISIFERAMKKMVYRVIFLLFIFTGIMASINYIIDPFDIFGSNFLKKSFQKNERFIKIEYLTKNNINFNSYLIGSSRIGPTDPEMINKYILGAKFYNFTIASATLTDELDHIKYMIKAGYPIKNLYLQVDITDNMMSYKHPTSDYLRKQHPYLNDESMIIYYIDYLINPFPKNVKGKIVKNLSATNNEFYSIQSGMWSYPNVDKEIDKNCQKYTANEISFSTKRKPFIKNTYTNVNLISLSKIIELCKKNNINLIIFTTPNNHNYLDRVYEDEYYTFLKGLTSVTNFWDFSGYNTVTLNDCNYYESSHYRPKVAKLIAARIFNDNNITLPTDFGTYITLKNIDTHII